MSVVLQLATIEKERKRAADYIHVRRARSSRALLSEYDNVALRWKADLISALVSHGSLPTSVNRLRTCVAIHTAMANASYHPRFTVAEMNRFAANGQLAKLQAESRIVGSTSRRGDLPTAVVLEVLGHAANAWTLPHQTEERRDQELHMCSLLVFCVFGAAMRDVSVLQSAQPVGSILTKQWLDLLSNNEARVDFKT